MKKIINYWESILLVITIIISITFFTLCNKNFYYHEFKKYNYYDDIYIDINMHYNECHISRKQIKNDINKYISHNMSITINNPRDCIKDDYYESSIKFNNKFNDIDVDLVVNIMFITSIILVIITGIIFKKTKHNHNINNILTITGILLIITYLMVRILINVNIKIFNSCIIDANKYLLVISGLIFSIKFYKFIKNKLFK